MKNTNIQLNEEEKRILTFLKGKKLNKYINDEFCYSNSVYGIVNLLINNEIYALESNEETIEYFGEIEDVSRLNFLKKEIIESKLKEVEQIKTTIDEKIENIYLIQERQTLFSNEDNVQELLLTRAIIFETKNTKIAFIKDSWLSQEIIILKGKNIEEKLLNDFEKVNHEIIEEATIITERFLEQL